MAMRACVRSMPRATQARPLRANGAQVQLHTVLQPVRVVPLRLAPTCPGRMISRRRLQGSSRRQCMRAVRGAPSLVACSASLNVMRGLSATAIAASIAISRRPRARLGTKKWGEKGRGMETTGAERRTRSIATVVAPTRARVGQPRSRLRCRRRWGLAQAPRLSALRPGRGSLAPRPRCPRPSPCLLTPTPTARLHGAASLSSSAGTVRLRVWHRRRARDARAPRTDVGKAARRDPATLLLAAQACTSAKTRPSQPSLRQLSSWRRRKGESTTP